MAEAAAFSIRHDLRQEVKEMASRWQSLAKLYEDRGKNAPNESECLRYAAMHGAICSCARELERILRKHAC